MLNWIYIWIQFDSENIIQIYIWVQFQVDSKNIIRVYVWIQTLLINDMNNI